MSSGFGGSTQPVGRGLRRLLWATALLTYGLIVFGGVVRTTGSGLGCPDWPLCHGRLLPPPVLTAWIEWGHRLIASLVGLFVISAVGVAWAQLGTSHRVTRLLALSVPLLVVQSGLGGLAVVWELPSEVVALHLALALTILALFLSAAVLGHRPQALTRARRRSPFYRRARRSALLLFLLIVTGAWVTGTRAGWACPDWPLCSGRLWPFEGRLPQIHMLHRYAALLVGVVLLALALEALRRPEGIDGAARRWAVATGLLFLAQVGVGGLNVWLRFPVWLNALHLALAAAVWAGAVLTVALEGSGPPLPRETGEGRARRRGGRPSRLRAYVALTKPGIVLLLLISTLGGMLVAARGFPSPRLLAATLIASALAAGGANALNSYQDRDIDGRMQRTARRPLPRGDLSPRQALTFGLVSVALGVLLMAWWVNGAAALWTLIGAVWYAWIYTRWLKRRTAQNIVWGGVAGALAPLVGWVAVTGRMHPLAVLLFALIFFWTPPHTWAFVLLVERDYRQVGIPMLPIVAGPAAAARQIWLYSWIVVAVALAPALLGEVGALYLGGALVLNLLFLLLAYRLLRTPNKALASRLYHYSNAYLFLLFALLAIDRMGGLLY